MAFLHLITALVLTLSSLQQGEQLFLENKPREALPHLEKALFEHPQDEKIYLYLGVIYEQIGDAEKSIQILKRGLNALQINGSLEVAYLNRANSRLELEEFQDARQDYIDYLRLDPDTPQRENIEKLIALLGRAIEDAERKRLEELERQKALLNEVLDTLKNASEDTRNLSAGSEEIQEEYEEVDIEN
jgi:tetratricopeptide (TPR) repeat protein